MNYNEYMFDPLYRVWRQKELKVEVEYGGSYFSKDNRDTSEFMIKAAELSTLRVNFISPYISSKPNKLTSILDIGAGLGSFVSAASMAFPISEGYEPFKYNHSLIKSVPLDYIWSWKWDVVTFFDTLEHFPIIEDAVTFMKRSRYVVISLPACHKCLDYEWFMSWKHRKPGEHLWHFDLNSLRGFMLMFGFIYIDHGYPEDKIRGKLNPEGQPNILTAIFRRANA